MLPQVKKADFETVCTYIYISVLGHILERTKLIKLASFMAFGASLTLKHTYDRSVTYDQHHKSGSWCVGQAA